jgi:hypothetical protein
MTTSTHSVGQIARTKTNRIELFEHFKERDHLHEHEAILSPLQYGWVFRYTHGAARRG